MNIPIYAWCIAFAVWLLLTHYGADVWGWVKVVFTSAQWPLPPVRRSKPQRISPSYADLPWYSPPQWCPPDLGHNAGNYTYTNLTTTADVPTLDELVKLTGKFRPNPKTPDAFVYDNGSGTMYGLKYPEPWMFAGIPMFETGS